MARDRVRSNLAETGRRALAAQGVSSVGMSQGDLIREGGRSRIAEGAKRSLKAQGRDTSTMSREELVSAGHAKMNDRHSELSSRRVDGVVETLRDMLTSHRYEVRVTLESLERYVDGESSDFDALETIDNRFSTWRRETISARRGSGPSRYNDAMRTNRPKMKKDAEARYIFQVLESQPEENQVPLMLLHLHRLRMNRVQTRRRQENRRKNPK